VFAQHSLPTACRLAHSQISVFHHHPLQAA
jgi:hypothetical protein